MDFRTIFMIMIGILFVLAVFDLIIGVSNDAVNFLLSAIGSKVAPKVVIMIVACLGVFIGATTSSGMMEVARKGIINPGFFTFNEIMIIFLAVMLTDIIVLDIYNTLGMPTSTTVSLVFGLLGATVAMSMIIISKNEQGIADLGKYINTAKAFVIVFGILLSVVISFTMGAGIQFLSRLLFSFNYKKTFKYFGALWSGVALTAITYYVFIEGVKGMNLTGETKVLYDKLISNLIFFIIFSFVGWTLLLGILQFVFKLNTLKVVVLVGTFALALAFAGNDLVNFVGVPLAGYESYKQWTVSGVLPNDFTMTGLSGNVNTSYEYLLISGAVMVLTLIFSRKAKNVTRTSLNLTRQYEGYERFEAGSISRSIVRMSMNFSKTFSKFVPNSIIKSINKRFEPVILDDKEDSHSFDLIRASVNLMVSGILISIGTSYKLPLSTTYVTFMVAMGTSLADRAWGRESAVYRVSGVLLVIGGWFITAFVAFAVSFIFAYIVYLGTFYAAIVLFGFTMFVLYRTSINHKNQELSKKQKSEKNVFISPISGNLYEKCNQNVSGVLKALTVLQVETIDSLISENRKSLKSLSQEINEISDVARSLKFNVYQTVRQLNDDSIGTAPYYVQVLDYLVELSHAVLHIVKPSYMHINNNHKTLKEQPASDLKNISLLVNEMFTDIYKIIEEGKFGNIEDIAKKKEVLLQEIDNIRKKQIKRIKSGEVGTRNSMLFLNLLAELKNIVLYSSNLLKAHKAFVTNQETVIYQ